LINQFNFQTPKSFHPPQKGTIIQNIQNNEMMYFIGEKIGKGHFGEVYECTDEWGNNLVAKILVPQDQTYEEVRVKWLEELNRLFYLRHPNITYVYDAFEYQHTFYLIIERCHATLKNLIEIPDFKGELWLPHIAREVLQGIHFIHNARHVHKDIHHDNIFVLQLNDRIIDNKDPNFIFKIGDLGISNLETDINIFNTILAQWMLPPEALNREYGVIGKQVDIYHCGLLLLSVLLGEIPQFTKNEILNGIPRQIAENLPSPYGKAIASALRRHTEHRTKTALNFWRGISTASGMIERQ
jgi:serine/threonine protein kinase